MEDLEASERAYELQTELPAGPKTGRPRRAPTKVSNRGAIGATILLAAAVALGACGLGGRPGQGAYVVNDFSRPVLVFYDASALLVPAGTRGGVYDESHQVKVYTIRVVSEDCQLLAETENRQWGLLITIQADGSVAFEHGANLSYQPIGTEYEPTAHCSTASTYGYRGDSRVSHVDARNGNEATFD